MACQIKPDNYYKTFYLALFIFDIFVLTILIYRFYFYKTQTNKQNNPSNFKCTELRKTKILIRAFIKSPAL